MSFHVATIWALLQLETPIFAPRGCLLIGSHLNVASSDTSCRIAFYGKVVQVLCPEKEALEALRVYKPKMRSAVVDRVVSELEVIGTNLLEKGGSVQPVRSSHGSHVVCRTEGCDEGRSGRRN